MAEGMADALSLRRSRRGGRLFHFSPRVSLTTLVSPPPLSLRTYSFSGGIPDPPPVAPPLRRSLTGSGAMHALALLFCSASLSPLPIRPLRALPTYCSFFQICDPACRPFVDLWPNPAVCSSYAVASVVVFKGRCCCVIHSQFFNGGCVVSHCCLKIDVGLGRW